MASKSLRRTFAFGLPTRQATLGIYTLGFLKRKGIAYFVVSPLLYHKMMC
jgi:hypothetical protein